MTRIYLLLTRFDPTDHFGLVVFQTVDTDLSSADNPIDKKTSRLMEAFQTVDTDLSSADDDRTAALVAEDESFRPLTRIYLLLTPGSLANCRPKRNYVSDR